MLLECIYQELSDFQPDLILLVGSSAFEQAAYQNTRRYCTKHSTVLAFGNLKPPMNLIFTKDVMLQTGFFN